MHCNVGKAVLAIVALATSAPALAAKPIRCADADHDGYKDAACGGNDCNDRNKLVNPGAAEVCGDGVDNNCNGVVDEGCTTACNTHSCLTWTGYGMCKDCHPGQANAMFGSVHYQWQGSGAEMQTGAGTQGKLDDATAGASALNAYCINILGNWNTYSGCSGCHTGLGTKPTKTVSDAQLANIDCLLCHSATYARSRVNGGLFQPAAGLDMNAIVKAVTRPARKNCLGCHAKAGGGDAVKRGDLALASGTTADRSYDVHMATTGANVACQGCHTFTGHRVAGRGSDLRPEDTTTEVSCSTSTCHPTKTSSTGHATTKINAHVARVACQSCHIRRYARNASDTTATEATEMHRDWSVSEFNATLSRYEPMPTKANDQLPRYRFWNGYSWGNNLKEPAVLDGANYKISRPYGAIDDSTSKLYPFKYKTSRQALDTTRNVLVAIDTGDYFQYGIPSQAVTKGLANMGYSGDAWTWVTTDEYQVLNHQVAPKESVVQCAECHPNASSTQVKLVSEVGYSLKAAQSTVCTQCHSQKSWPGYSSGHSKHVDSLRYDCSLCHGFSRPERGLKTSR